RHLPLRQQALVRPRPEGGNYRRARASSTAARQPAAGRRSAHAAWRDLAPAARARASRGGNARHHSRALERRRRRAAAGLIRVDPATDSRGHSLPDVPVPSPKPTDKVIAAGTGRITDLAWISALYELGQKAANGANPQQVRQEILEHIVRGFDAE